MRNHSYRTIGFICFLSLMLLFSAAFASGYSINSGAGAVLTQRMSARSGPGNSYQDLGTYFESGTEISTLTSARDRNGSWWIQVDFSYHGNQRRAYAPAGCFSIDAGSLPCESAIGQVTVSADCTAFYGPGQGYARYDRQVPAGTSATVFAYENGYAQIEYTTSGGALSRVWVSKSSL